MGYSKWAPGIAAALLLALPSPASAPALASPDRARWLELSREIASPWPALQRRRGVLPDFSDRFRPVRRTNTTRYGEAVMGYAMLQVGTRDRERRLVRAGLRAVGYAVGIRRRVRWPRSSVFEIMSVAAAYNLARRRLARHPVFRRQRHRWASWLRRARVTRLHVHWKLGNHWLAEGVAVLELMRTGLRSRRRGTVLGSGRRRARRLARRLFLRRVPRRARGQRTVLLSDAPDHPVPYHALSYGLYARGVALLGRRAPRATRTTLRRLGNASLLLEDPGGDVAWAGRSQGQAWTLTATAYGSAVTDRLGPGRGRRYAGLRARTLERLRTAYRVGRRGLDIVPAMSIDQGLGTRAIDYYAGTPSMNGLTLMFLNWTLQGVPRTAAARPPRQRRRAARVLSRGNGRLAVVRRPDLWYAVKARHSGREAFWGDLRYDSGLMTAQSRRGSTWRTIVPLRPRTGRFATDSAGPVLHRGRRRGILSAHSLRASRAGYVTAAGSFSTFAGRRLRRVVFRYRPVDCGVELRFRGRRGERYTLSGFFSGMPRRTGRTLASAHNRLTLNRPFRARLKDGYASAVDPHLVRARLAFRLVRSGAVRARFC